MSWRGPGIERIEINPRAKYFFPSHPEGLGACTRCRALVLKYLAGEAGGVTSSYVMKSRNRGQVYFVGITTIMVV